MTFLENFSLAVKLVTHYLEVKKLNFVWKTSSFSHNKKSRRQETDLFCNMVCYLPLQQELALFCQANTMKSLEFDHSDTRKSFTYGQSERSHFILQKCDSQGTFSKNLGHYENLIQARGNKIYPEIDQFILDQTRYNKMALAPHGILEIFPPLYQNVLH